jgi:hypothetical protein
MTVRINPEEPGVHRKEDGRTRGGGLEAPASVLCATGSKVT